MSQVEFDVSAIFYETKKLFMCSFMNRVSLFGGTVYLPNNLGAGMLKPHVSTL